MNTVEDPTLAQLVELMKQGLSHEEIGNKVKLSETTIRTRLQRHPKYEELKKIAKEVRERNLKEDTFQYWKTAASLHNKMVSAERIRLAVSAYRRDYMDPVMFETELKAALKRNPQLLAV